MHASETGKSSYQALFLETFRKWTARNYETHELAERVRIGMVTNDEMERFRQLRRSALKNAAIMTLCTVAFSAILILST